MEVQRPDKAKVAGSIPAAGTTEILPESRREPRDMAVLIVALAVDSRKRRQYGPVV